MNYSSPKISNDWDIILKDDFQKKSFTKLMRYIYDERKIYTIFPKEEDVFSAFKLCSFSKTKIVIIGQDPYHGDGQANGLAFSVPENKTPPPSLRNILKELQADLKIHTNQHGNLESWAQQGILLLNAILTVRKKEAGSHQNLGWEKFTDSVISKLSFKKSNLIFLLWGVFAQKKAALINEKKHYILKASHPSPFSVHKGFLGSKHFSKTNKILIKNNQQPINWDLCKNTLTLF